MCRWKAPPMYANAITAGDTPGLRAGNLLTPGVSLPAAQVRWGSRGDAVCNVRHPSTTWQP